MLIDNLKLIKLFLEHDNEISFHNNSNKLHTCENLQISNGNCEILYQLNVETEALWV